MKPEVGTPTITGDVQGGVAATSTITPFNDSFLGCLRCNTIGTNCVGR